MLTNLEILDFSSKRRTEEPMRTEENRGEPRRAEEIIENHFKKNLKQMSTLTKMLNRW